MEKRKAIENLIPELIPTLPANQKKAADFFPARLDWVAWLPIRDVAAIAGGSEASIIRFAPPSGDDGYPEFGNKLSTALKNQLPPTGDCHDAMTENENTPDLFRFLAHNVITLFNATIKSLDTKIFATVVDGVIAAPGIFCFKMELSHHLPRRMTYFLRRYNYPAYYRVHDDSPYREALACLNPKNLLIAFSFSPDSRKAVAAIIDTKTPPVLRVTVTDNKIPSVRECAPFCLSIKTVLMPFNNSRGRAGQGAVCESAQTEFLRSGPNLKYAKYN